MSPKPLALKPKALEPNLKSLNPELQTCVSPRTFRLVRKTKGREQKNASAILKRGMNWGQKQARHGQDA